MDYVKDFGSYLKNLRMNKGLTLKDLSSLSEVSTAYLSQLENGKRGIPSKDILEKLSFHLDISYEKLLERAGYIKFRDLRNNLVHKGLEEFLKQHDIDQFIEDTLDYCIVEISKLLTDEKIPAIKREKLLSDLSSFSYPIDNVIKDEYDLLSLKEKILEKINPEHQLFFVLTLVDNIQNLYRTSYESNIEMENYKSLSSLSTSRTSTSSINESRKNTKISRLIRYRVLRRDRSTCQVCGAKAPDTKIDVDYKDLSMDGSENIDNLQAICSDCQIGMSEEYKEAFEHVETVSR